MTRRSDVRIGSPLLTSLLLTTRPMETSPGPFPFAEANMFGGIRRNVAPPGLATLSHSPERQVDEYFARVDPEGDWGAAHSESDVRSRIESTRHTGYAERVGPPGSG